MYLNAGLHNLPITFSLFRSPSLHTILYLHVAGLHGLYSLFSLL